MQSAPGAPDNAGRRLPALPERRHHKALPPISSRRRHHNAARSQGRRVPPAPRPPALPQSFRDAPSAHPGPAQAPHGLPWLWPSTFLNPPCTRLRDGGNSDTLFLPPLPGAPEPPGPECCGAGRSGAGTAETPQERSPHSAAQSGSATAGGAALPRPGGGRAGGRTSTSSSQRQRPPPATPARHPCGAGQAGPCGRAPASPGRGYCSPLPSQLRGEPRVLLPAPLTHGRRRSCCRPGRRRDRNPPSPPRPRPRASVTGPRPRTPQRLYTAARGPGLPRAVPASSSPPQRGCLRCCLPGAAARGSRASALGWEVPGGLVHVCSGICAGFARGSARGSAPDLPEALPGTCPQIALEVSGVPPGICPGWAAVTPPVSVGPSGADTSPARGSDSPSIPLLLRAGITDIMEVDPAPGVTVITVITGMDPAAGSFLPLPRVSGRIAAEFTGLLEHSAGFYCKLRQRAGPDSFAVSLKNTICTN